MKESGFGSQESGIRGRDYLAPSPRYSGERVGVNGTDKVLMLMELVFQKTTSCAKGFLSQKPNTRRSLYARWICRGDARGEAEQFAFFEFGFCSGGQRGLSGCRLFEF